MNPNLAPSRDVDVVSFPCQTPVEHRDDPVLVRDAHHDSHSCSYKSVILSVDRFPYRSAVVENYQVDDPGTKQMRGSPVACEVKEPGMHHHKVQP